ncbi:putative non-ribosomal peptide synthase [Bradyrhizobium oligotrophicum S58]|uniref:Putative non-ribosomal peptide synthase n=1 Tax=Bradyrhizobium oligotrophicum S58 TaxID=1245469 RepID=M4ZBM9_9BRAD|nr:non-ribosomal peptide synthetase [Bradyrhizobium oligotrophicum]BAM91288.1 putative non-ribosomal peptide synthase [Bradyrhizobium oligotrophicum S58]
MRIETLVERLREHAVLRADHVALRFIEGDDVAEELTFAALDQRIRALAAHLQELAGEGERAVLLLPNGPDYAVAFYACLYAGVIAVPAYPPEAGKERYTSRLEGILRDASPRFILTQARLRDSIAASLGRTVAHIVAVDALRVDAAASWREPDLKGDAIAFLQYTSGSTSQPKGVCVTHRNLVANEIAIEEALGGTRDDVFVSWLPLYHDMGLMGGLLNPLFTGFTAVLMSPRNFLEQPRRWLDAIHRHGGTCSGGPDFAFALCVDRVSDEAIARLDLSRWRFAFSGSEFVRRATLERFAERFRTTGFDSRALTPCYGLAEATLLVTAGDRQSQAACQTLDPVALGSGRIAEADEGTDLMACGTVADGHAVRIMRSDASAEADANEIGEIWVAGPSVAKGYWNNPQATAQAFVARDGARWLRTGDLGFVRDGTLVVTGRLKDLLIVRGQNIYPFDLEQAVETDVTSVRKGRVAAFPVEIDGAEGIGIAAEFSRVVLRRTPSDVLIKAIGEAVMRQTQEYPAVVVLLNPQGIPLTTSGKLQRSACRAGWAQGTLDSFMVFERGRQDADLLLVSELASETERRLASIWQDVLRVAQVSRDDDFFMLGGNSIAAAQIAGMVRDRFGVELDLRCFFDAPTLAALAAQVDATNGKCRVLPLRAAPPGARELLSPAQERLWFLWSMDPDSTAYTIACAVQFEGHLDQALLVQALTEVVARHEALRTTFVAQDGRAKQVIHAALDIPVAVEDLRRCPRADRAQRVAARTRDELGRPFDLAHGPLLRAVLMQLAHDRYELLLTAHHIVADGLSLDVLLAEISAIYDGLRRGAGTLPAPSAIQYADYAAWQREWLGSPEADQQLAYWRRRLGETHSPLVLPFDRPRPPVQSYRGDTIHVEIASDLALKLRSLARQQRVSMFMLLLAAYQLLLFRYSGQSDLRVGVPVAGRRQAELASLIGCFVNTLVLRADIADDMSFADLLEQAKEEVISGLAHQDIPFDRLVDALKPARSGGHNPLFQVKFNYMAAPRGFTAVDGLRADARIIDLAGSHFDLALDIVDGAANMTASLNYATDLFDVASVERVGRQLVDFLQQIADGIDRPLADFTLARDVRQVVAQDVRRFAFTDMLGLIAAASADRGDQIALRQGQIEVSVAELERWSDRIARALAAHGVTRETPVALWIERSPAFVAALLGVLKAGGAYVPLDPAWPVARIERILHDGAITRLIADVDRLAAAEALDCLVIDAEGRGNDSSDVFVPFGAHPAQTAYVIYTSGSTGAPKGVAVSHGAVANYVQALLSRLQPRAGASMAMVSTVAADLGHTVLFGALASGATLNLLAADAAFDADTFAQAMRDGEVGILKIVPSHLRGLLRARRSADMLPRDVLILGGEPSDPALIEDVRRLRPQCRIINHYGPTETTVGVTTHEWGEADHGAVPVGLPLANLRAHVLDDALNEVPCGAAGELYVGGAGLARGYRGAPGQTAERFIPDPFGPAGERLYRTGDRVRCDQAGRIIFLGRRDDQIKLRGYRIEPAEIARVITSRQGIADAVVVARAIDADQERQELVAYCVAAPGTTLRPDGLRQQLAALLPDYMVPTRVIMLERLPLSANGKLDRAALPQPDDETVAVYAAPVGAAEQAIAAVWQQVLGRDRIGRNDNFFELGGDSILSLQIIARLRKRGMILTPKQMFAQQTIAALAGVVVTTSTPAVTSPAAARRAVNAGAAELLPIQLRFFSETIANRDHFNQAVLLIPQAQIEWSVLQRALAAVVMHHDALRIAYRRVGEVWQGSPADVPAASDLLWIRSGVQLGDIGAIAAAAQASLSLASGTLLRAVGFDLVDGSQRLLVAIHHLAVDGVSWRILLEDIASACAQIASGAAVALPPNSDSPSSWAQRLSAHASSERLAEQMPFWLASSSGSDLPCDHDHGGVDVEADADEVVLSVDPALTARLLEAAPAAYRTQVNDLLLAALSRAIWNWSGREDVAIELEGHGREDIFAGADITRTVGWFTSAFPVRLGGGGEPDGALIKRVKETLRSIPDHGLGYGVLRYLGAPEHRDVLARTPSPRIVFNYLGRFDADLGAKAAYRMAPESPGSMRAADTPLRAWLTVNGEVREGQLSLAFRYGRRRYRRATVERLAELYKAALRGLVDHCLGTPPCLTPSDVPLSGLDQAALDRLCATLDCSNVEDIYPLSPMQEGMLFHAIRDGKDDAYVNQLAVELRGVSPAQVREAWQEASARHAVLRTGFVWEQLSGAAQQIVHRRLDAPVVEDDWRGAQRAGSDLDAALAEAAQRERALGFDVTRPPLQRLRLIRLNEDKVWLIWTHHHIVLDGWSSARLIADVLQQIGGGAPAVAQGSYRDYIAWLQTRDQTAAAEFWRRTLRKFNEPTRLADTLRASGTIAGMTGHGRVTSVLDGDLTVHLRRFATQQRITMNTLLQGAWVQLLRQFTGQDRVCFGVTVAGRPAELAGAEGMVGLFINTLPLIDGPHPQTELGDWLRALQGQNVAARDYEWMPLHEIQRLAGEGGQSLFDSIMVFENYPIDQALTDQESAGRRIGKVEHVTPTNYPLAVAAFDGAEGLRLDFNYDRAQLGERAVRLLSAAMRDWLAQISADATRPTGCLHAIGCDALACILRWSGSAASQTTSGRSLNVAAPCVVTQIEAQAARAADATAIISGDHAMSYGELNAQANRLARRLRARGIGADMVVGLALERGPMMMVALLAVLKTGAAYLPLDPDYPAERLAYMVRDSGARLLLTQATLHAGFAPALAEIGAEAWLLDSSAAEEAGEAGNLDVTIHPESLAYVIYTSGSTGSPKGVMVRHGALTNFLAAMAEQPGIVSDDRVLGLTSLSFDIAVLELWLPLAHGAQIVLADRSAAHDPSDLKALVARHGVTMMQATPSSWRMLIDHEGSEPWLPWGCRVLSGGEALPPDLARRLAELGRDVWNMYGPTETTVWSARHRLDADHPAPVLGGPIGHTTLYVLDANLNLAPVDVAGELFIGGEGLARGYWKRGALSAERFIPDPFDAAGGRLYRTGDLVRWRSDGVLDYVGRADHQVKIRGHRIELGEIEARLLELPGVRDSVVVAQKLGGDRQLIGYVSGEERLDGAELRTNLASLLPDYMLPSRVMVLPRLPLTPNGKIDRRKLPSPWQGETSRHAYEAPIGEIEITLARIWTELLGVDRVGRNDRFFELGGHSLLAVRLMSRVAQEFGVSVQLSKLFAHSELAEFARIVSISLIEEEFEERELQELIEAEV